MDLQIDKGQDKIQDNSNCTTNHCDIYNIITKTVNIQNVTGVNTKPDQLGRDNLARTDPAVGAMVLPTVSIICFEVVQNDSIKHYTIVILS